MSTNEISPEDAPREPSATENEPKGKTTAKKRAVRKKSAAAAPTRKKKGEAAKSGAKTATRTRVARPRKTTAPAALKGLAPPASPPPQEASSIPEVRAFRPALDQGLASSSRTAPVVTRAAPGKIAPEYRHAGRRGPDEDGSEYRSLPLPKSAIVDSRFPGGSRRGVRLDDESSTPTLPPVPPLDDDHDAPDERGERERPTEALADGDDGQQRRRRRGRRGGRRRRRGADDRHEGAAPGAEEHAAPAPGDAADADLEGDDEFEDALDGEGVTEIPDVSELRETPLSADERFDVAEERDAADDAPMLKPLKRTGVEPTKTLLVNAREEVEVRIAIVGGAGVIEEFAVERASHADQLGNIIKGRVVNIEPSIQAAFIDIGAGKNGFLHFTDVMPAYEFEKDVTKVARFDMTGKPRTERRIERMLRRGDEVLVQVTKDEIAKKGPSLTTYVSLPGRFCVLMPGLNRKGVSRRIENDRKRRALKSVIEEIESSDRMGYIIRTAGGTRVKDDIKNDIAFLEKTWDGILHRARARRAPTTAYRESDLVMRTIRDLYNEEIKEVVIDEEDVYERVLEVFMALMPDEVERVHHYGELFPLFHRFQLEEQLETFLFRRVPMPSGASIVIDQTEALVAIDVNSGKFMGERDPEKLALKVNEEAVPEICRQIRIRDIGGLVLIDFIDMREPRHRRRIESLMREHLDRDRARFKVSRMSQFGIMEITRQRVREGMSKITHDRCQTCKGTGRVRSLESESLALVRKIQVGLARPEVEEIRVFAPHDLAAHFCNDRRKELYELEVRFRKKISIIPEAVVGEEVPVHYLDHRGERVGGRRRSGRGGA